MRFGGFAICLILLPLAGCALSPKQETFVYKQVGDVSLEAHVFTPRLPTLRKRAGLAYAHSGGWSQGGPGEGAAPASYFAARGMTAVSFQYRLSNEADITPLDAMEDFRDAVIWMRSNAESLRIRTDRIAAAGSSAGGHLAACAAIFPQSREGESSAPDALLLWNPALDVVADKWFVKLVGGDVEAKAASPAHHVRPGLPPTILFQGEKDGTTPAQYASSFATMMLSQGNRADYVLYKNRGHMVEHDPALQIDTLRRADRFLIELGFLDGAPDERRLGLFSEK